MLPLKAQNINTDMQTISYRITNNYILMALIGLLLVAISCKKETESNSPPKLSMISDSGYITKDTSLPVGARIKIGVEAIAGAHNVTFLQVSCNTGEKRILLDSGMNCASFKYDLSVIKSVSQQEKWTFLVMDKDRNKDSISITFNRSASNNYGSINTYSAIELGAQSNTTSGSFLSLTSGNSYNLSEAFLNQALIDLIYYYGPYNATLSSPNESEAPTFFTGTEGISNWLVKNETRYDTTLITPYQFDRAANDSLLLSAYEPASGKRKAKYVTEGSVYSFTSQTGRIGLLKVLKIEPGAEGYMQFSVKIQN